MKRLPLIRLGVVAAVLAAGGCAHISLFGKRKPHGKNPDKVGSHIATQVEKDFMARWVAKRSAELIAQGQSPEAANNQAAEEFREKYKYTTLVAGGK